MKKTKSGAALITVVMVMVVLTILGIALLNTAIAETRHASLQERKIQAHYIGRSGIYVATKIINSKLPASGSVPDLQVFINGLNTYVTNIKNNTPNEFNVDGKGSFNITYELSEPGGIKILSTGTVSGTPAISDLVTCIINVSPSVTLTGNPKVWVSGINLKKGVNPSDLEDPSNPTGPTKSYLGKAVGLKGKPIQSPMGGTSEASTFQATLIYFTDYRDLSFRQVNNSIPLEFDAEILYFESGVELNKTGDSVKFSISDTTLAHRTTSTDVLPLFAPAAGFQDINRYRAFAGVASTPVYDTPFALGVNYGIVYFGSDVKSRLNGGGLSTAIIKGEYPTTNGVSGYYYYKNGANLRSPASDDFIKIPSDDPIITALDNLFKGRASLDEAVWNNK